MDYGWEGMKVEFEKKNLKRESDYIGIKIVVKIKWMNHFRCGSDCLSSLSANSEKLLPI